MTQLEEIIGSLTAEEEISFYRSAVGNHAHIRLRNIRTKKSKHQALPMDDHLNPRTVLKLIDWLRQRLKQEENDKN